MFRRNANRGSGATALLVLIAVIGVIILLSMAINQNSEDSCKANGGHMIYPTAGQGNVRCSK